MVAFWTKVTDIMAMVVGQSVPRDPRWLLLMVKGDHRWPRHAELWLALAAGVAKRNIARAWGSRAPPHWDQWRKDLAGVRRQKRPYIKAGAALKNGGKYGGLGGGTGAWTETYSYGAGVATPVVIVNG